MAPKKFLKTISLIMIFIFFTMNVSYAFVIAGITITSAAVLTACQTVAAVAGAVTAIAAAAPAITRVVTKIGSGIVNLVKRGYNAIKGAVTAVKEGNGALKNYLKAGLNKFKEKLKHPAKSVNKMLKGGAELAKDVYTIARNGAVITKNVGVIAEHTSDGLSLLTNTGVPIINQYAAQGAAIADKIEDVADDATEAFDVTGSTALAINTDLDNLRNQISLAAAQSGVLGENGITLKELGVNADKVINVFTTGINKTDFSTQKLENVGIKLAQTGNDIIKLIEAAKQGIMNGQNQVSQINAEKLAELQRLEASFHKVHTAIVEKIIEQKTQKIALKTEKETAEEDLNKEKEETPKPIFTCSECGKKYKTQKGLDSHMTKKHLSASTTKPETEIADAKPVLKCPECGKEYKTQRGLDNHIKTKHAKATEEVATEIEKPVEKLAIAENLGKKVETQLADSLLQTNKIEEKSEKLVKEATKDLPIVSRARIKTAEKLGDQKDIAYKSYIDSVEKYSLEDERTKAKYEDYKTTSKAYKKACSL